MNWKKLKLETIALLVLCVVTIAYPVYWLQNQEIELSFPVNPSSGQKELICKMLEMRTFSKQNNSIGGTCLGSVGEWWKGEGLSEYEKEQVARLGVYQAPSWMIGVESMSLDGFKAVKVLLVTAFGIGVVTMLFVKWKIFMFTGVLLVFVDMITGIYLLSFVFGGLWYFLYEQVVEELSNLSIKDDSG